VFNNSSQFYSRQQKYQAALQQVN
jgi:predicted Holliday junction resolvase-like endonuclease